MIELAKPKTINSGKTKNSSKRLTTPSLLSTNELTTTPVAPPRGNLTNNRNGKKLQTANDRKLYKLSLKRAAIALNLLNQMLTKL